MTRPSSAHTASTWTSTPSQAVWSWPTCRTLRRRDYCVDLEALVNQLPADFALPDAVELVRRRLLTILL